MDTDKTDKSFAGLILPHFRREPSQLPLGFFVLLLFERLCAMGPAPAIDLMQYTRSLQSFN